MKTAHIFGDFLHITKYGLISLAFIFSTGRLLFPEEGPVSTQGTEEAQGGRMQHQGEGEAGGKKAEGS